MIRPLARRIKRGLRSLLTPPDLTPAILTDTAPAARPNPPAAFDPTGPATERDAFPLWEEYEKKQARRLFDGFHLVIGPPKAGTTTLIETLGAMNLPGFRDSVHALSEPLLLGGFLWGDPNRPDFPLESKMWQLKRHWQIAAQLDLFRKLQAELAKAGRQNREPRPHLLIPVREPVSRYLSEIYYQDFYEHGRVTIAPEHAQMAMLHRHHPLGHYWWALDEWIRLEIEGGFGVDLFSRPFDTAQGWKIYEDAAVRVLVIRQENMKSLSAALATFYNISPASIVVPQANIGEENAYGDAYRAAKDQIRLPAELLTEAYSGRFAQHFYTEKERHQFIQRWIRE